jgi:hypothetical protein
MDRALATARAIASPRRLRRVDDQARRLGQRRGGRACSRRWSWRTARRSSRSRPGGLQRAAEALLARRRSKRVDLVDRRRRHAGELAHRGNRLGQHVDLQRSAALPVLQHRHAVRAGLARGGDAFVDGDGPARRRPGPRPRTRPRASCGARWPAATSGEAPSRSSVAPVSTASGFQLRLLIILAQIQARMSGTGSGLRPAAAMASARACRRGDSSWPSGSPIGKRSSLPSWCIDAGLDDLGGHPVDAADRTLGTQRAPLRGAGVEPLDRLPAVRAGQAMEVPVGDAGGGRHHGGVRARAAQLQRRAARPAPGAA